MRTKNTQYLCHFLCPVLISKFESAIKGVMNSFKTIKHFIFFFSVYLSLRTTRGSWVPLSDETLAVAANNSTVCTERISLRESHYVPYWETYRHKVLGLFYKIKTRLNYRQEYYTVWRTKLKCCAGYEEGHDGCIPSCLGGCLNAVCVEPNVCKCIEHYKKSDRHNICLPICTNECIHGTCILPEVCKCDPGYWMDNDGYSCRPICDGVCPNHSTCVSPNTCSCDAGYKVSYSPDGSQICEPICDSPCVNGKCVAFNQCECNNGFIIQPDDPFTCKPVCEEACVFGTCTALNTCTCNPGYKLKLPNVCEPVCSEPCVHGTCVAPESCSCDDGYGLLEFSRYVCEPICETGCNNGTCTAPNVCTCNEGYQFVIKDYIESSVVGCMSVCEFLCEPYGECVSPNVCKCKEGYRLEEKNKTYNNTQLSQNNKSSAVSVCKPVCEPPCQNGVCIEPNKCECNQGYQLTNDTKNICVPICTNCVKYSTCVAPDICKCEDGYRSTMNNRSSFECQPLCDPDCENGICTDHNVCSCNDGYKNVGENSTSGPCIPHCTINCENATCIAPDVCRCNDGFVKNPQKKSCKPFCGSGCKNGICIAPNQCQCEPGFVERESEAAKICMSECTRNCSGHGTCVDSEIACVCSFGWTGWNCEESNVCMLSLNRNDVNYDDVKSRINIINDVNSTIEEARDNVPGCHSPCINFLNNETLCISISSDVGNDNATSIGCFLSTNLACYVKDEYTISSNTSTATASIVATVVFLIVCSTIVGYLLFRKRQKKNIDAGFNQNTLLHEATATESLISEDGDYL